VPQLNSTCFETRVSARGRAQFVYPVAVAEDHSGYLYVNEYGDQQGIRKADFFQKGSSCCSVRQALPPPRQPATLGSTIAGRIKQMPLR